MPDLEDKKESQSTPSAKMAPNFRRSQAIVTIKVSYGKDQETFVVHKNFICFYSPYFAAAFNGPFKEGETQVLELEDVHPIVFAVFVDWIYSQRVQNYQSEGNELNTLIELWLLADRILIPRLQNQVLETLEEERLKLKLRATALCKRVYEKTTDGSPLRRYLAWINATTKGSLFRSSENKFPRAMLVDMVELLASERWEKGGRWITFPGKGTKEFYVDEQGKQESELRSVGSKPADEDTISIATDTR